MRYVKITLLGFLLLTQYNYQPDGNGYRMTAPGEAPTYLRPFAGGGYSVTQPGMQPGYIRPYGEGFQYQPPRPMYGNPYATTPPVTTVPQWHPYGE